MSIFGHFNMTKTETHSNVWILEWSEVFAWLQTCVVFLAIFKNGVSEKSQRHHASIIWAPFLRQKWPKTGLWRHPLLLKCAKVCLWKEGHCTGQPCSIAGILKCTLVHFYALLCTFLQSAGFRGRLVLCFFTKPAYGSILKTVYKKYIKVRKSAQKLLCISCSRAGLAGFVHSHKTSLPCSTADCKVLQCKLCTWCTACIRVGQAGFVHLHKTSLRTMPASLGFSH